MKEETPAPVKDTPSHEEKSNWWHKSERKFLWVAVIILFLLLLWAIWHKQMADLWSSLTGSKSNQALITPVSNVTAGTGTEQGTNNGSTSDRSSSSETNSTTTTTNNTTTNNPTPDPAPPTPTPTPPSSLTNLFAEVSNGQDKNKLISLAGTAPSACTVLGTQEVCTWLNNGSAVVVTMVNGNVTGKTKVGF